jgi:prevent-host-death family protein
MAKTPNIQVVTATEAKNRFGDMLKRVYQRDEHLIVERDGIPVAVLVPIQDYNAMPSVKGTANAVEDALERERRRALAAADMREFLDRVQEGKPVYSEEEVQKDIENAIRAVRGG